MRGNAYQSMDYYPFGMPFGETISGTYPDYQPYKYNGKELDRMHGLDNYDYGARQYNPIAARWDRMDPLCEKYYSISPYAYCGNNPVNAIDPDGCDWEISSTVDENKFTHYNIHITGVLYNSTTQDIDMDKLKTIIEKQISETFSFSKGTFDVSTSVDIRTVSSVEEINETDHVFNIIEQKNLGEKELALSDVGGLQVRLGTTLVNKIFG
jgi:RHS repeat-associated protein